MLFAVICMNSFRSEAAVVRQNVTCFFFNTSYAKTCWVNVPLKGLKKGLKELTKVESNNKKVFKSAQISYNSKKAVSLELKKPGKVTVKIQGKAGNKTVSYILNVKAVKFELPFRTFKVGDVTYPITKDKMYYHNVKMHAAVYSAEPDAVIKGKIKIVPKKNWSLKKVDIYDCYTLKKIANTKNGNKIDLEGEKKFTYNLRAEFYNKKTKVTEIIVLGRTRADG